MKPLAFALLTVLFAPRLHAQPAALEPSAALHPPAAQSAAWQASAQRQIKELSEDFNAVISGRKPVHARLDTKTPVPADGGTTFYLGDGYQLTIEQSLCTIGGVNGLLYGPVITLSSQLANGNDNQISHVTFYRMEEFRKFRDKTVSRKTPSATPGH